MRALYIVVPAVAMLGLGAATVSGQERQGRFTMSPVDDGFVRLDTQSGEMSMCARRDGKWACEPMTDQTAALHKEIEDLKAENERLSALAGAPPPRTGEGLGAIRPEKKLELPSEEDVDRAFDYVEGIFRKFRDRLKEFEKEENLGKKGTPL